MKKLLVLLGAIALTLTLASAEGKCGEGKCGGNMKTEQKCNGAQGDNHKKAEKKKAKSEEMKCAAGKCGGAAKPSPTKS